MSLANNYYSKSFLSSKFKFSLIISIFVIMLFLSSLLFAFNTFGSKKYSIEMVSGTEYISGEQGQVIIKLLDDNKKPIEDGKCLVSILYPDKSYFLIDKEMSKTSVPGNYYYSFIISKVEGVYEEHIVCKTKDSVPLYISSSFHVSIALNNIMNMADYQKEELTKLESIINNFNKLDDNLEKINNRLSLIENQVTKNSSDYNNLKLELSNFNDDLNSLDDNINQIKISYEELDSKLEEKISSNFEKISDKFKDTAKSMYSIFE